MPRTHVRENLATAIDEFLADADQIRTLIQQPDWLSSVSSPQDKTDVLITRLIFELERANECLTRTKTHVSELMQLRR